MSELVVNLEPLEDGEFRYLLLDGAQCVYPPRKLLSDKWVGEAAALFDGVLADGSRDAAPYLIKLRDEQKTQSAHAALQGKLATEGAASWLDSSLDHAEMCARLSRRLATGLPNGKQMLLRVYDGRVLSHLASVLDREQTVAFFSFARRWWHQTPQLEWRSVSGAVESRDPMAGPLILSLEQRGQLQDACYPYSILEHFLDTAPELLEKIPAKDRYEFFRSTIAAAENLGLTSGSDMVLFSTLALLEGHEFYSQPSWRVRLEQVAGGKRTLAKVFDEHYQEDEADVE